LGDSMIMMMKVKRSEGLIREVYYYPN